MKFGLAQINPTVGDISGNVERVRGALAWARAAGVQVLALPELVVTGYPPEDLLLKAGFVRANREAVELLAADTSDTLTVIGFVDQAAGRLYNAAAICQNGSVLAVYHKQLLPNYGVFDERRYFEEGRGHVLIDTPDGVIGTCVCEDIWSATGPAVSQGDAGAQVVININASPFHKGKLLEREDMLAARARRAGSSIVYVNTVGGQDELVFDGASVVISAKGNVVARLPQFQEAMAVVDVPLGSAVPVKEDGVKRIAATLPIARLPADVATTTPMEPQQEVYSALTLALRDYVHKNGFEKVVVGLSGGIDSSLTAVIAADALSPDGVLGVAMPSEFSSSHSIEDAKTLAVNLGIDMVEIPITATYHAYLDAMKAAFGEAEAGIAEENIQARIRGNLLMAISNRYGHLVLATGNKSELAVGYSTLYGDMAGGFALLKDVFKQEVYSLARWRNRVSPVIPESVLTKPPSAELRPDQKDSDSLPEYEVLDPILEAYIEEDAGLEDIAAAGHDREIARRVIALVDRAEYKRRQAAPGPKVTTKAFGRDRRLPITNLWRGSRVKDPPERTT